MVDTHYWSKLVWHQEFLEVCNGIRGSQIQVLVTRGSPERSKLVLSVWHRRSWKSVTVSETVADQCINWSNALEAFDRYLKLVLARLAPGNFGNLRVYRGS